MRSTPAPVKGVEPRPFEYRLRFHAPLRNVELVPCDAEPSASHPLPTPAHQPDHEPLPKSAPPPAPQAANAAPAAPPPAPAASDFLPADLQEELKADRQRIEAVLAEMRAGLAKLRQAREGRLQEWQRAAIELAMTTTARVLHDRVTFGDFPIEAKVRDMIAQLGEDVPVVVRLNPLDLDLLKSRLEQAGDDSLVTGPDAPRFVADSSLNRGDCQVEGREGMLLSDVVRELHEIREELLRSLENARP